MAAVAEGAVDDDLARGGFETVDNFIHKDGDMSSSRGFTFCPQMLLDFGVSGKIVFFIFLVVGFRMCAGVSGATPVNGRLAGIAGLFGIIHIMFFYQKSIKITRC